MKTKIKHCTICKKDTVHFCKEGWELCSVCRKQAIGNPFGDFFERKVKK